MILSILKAGVFREFPYRLKNAFETAIVNEPSVLGVIEVSHTFELPRDSVTVRLL